MGRFPSGHPVTLENFVVEGVAKGSGKKLLSSATPEPTGLPQAPKPAIPVQTPIFIIFLRFMPFASLTEDQNHRAVLRRGFGDPFAKEVVGRRTRPPL
jgi:hypothetical protein